MTDNLFYAHLSSALSQEKQSQSHDDEVERRAEAMLIAGGKFDLADPDNIEEAICEAPPSFWLAIAKCPNAPQTVGNLCRVRVREYWYKRAKEEVEEELDDERMRAQNPELVNRDE